MLELDVLREKLNTVPPEHFDTVSALLDRLNNHPSGDIIAVHVSLEDYMEHYAADHCEWVEGYVIKMSPAELQHNRLIQYLYRLLEIYFEFRPMGQVISQPFVMRLPEFPNRRREPDLMVILNTNKNDLKKTYLDGPADICIEVVSEGSVERDRGEKFKEYEKGGVPEYWIIDPLHKEGLFYRLNDQGLYAAQNVDEHGNYRTPTLPGLRLHVPTLWEETLPTVSATLAAIQSMFDEEK